MARGGAADALDVLVVGAGVVGLAAAAALARAGRSLLIVESQGGIARETTSRNSEVVHAGIYYPAGSLKARLCVAGREALYERCARRGVPHRKLGKLIVASEPAEIARLEDLQTRGRANGVPGLEIIDRNALRRLEPAVEAVAALVSPETGIVDGHALSLSFLAEAEEHDAVLLLGSSVVGIEPIDGGWRVEVADGSGERSRVECAAVVNAAGLESDRIAALAGLDVDVARCRLHPCKGDYFSLAPSAGIALQHLVYPVPPATGLGIHATVDLGGRIRFGPDAEYVDRPRYDVDARKADRFAEAIRRYLPGVESAMLSPDYAGVRPRLTAPGESPRDFIVREESDAGLPGLVNCIGIESPGLTAAPAIGEEVARLLASL